MGAGNVPWGDEILLCGYVPRDMKMELYWRTEVPADLVGGVCLKY